MSGGKHRGGFAAAIGGAVMATSMAASATVAESLPPPLKPGLWEMSNDAATAAGARLYQCLDEDSQRLLDRRAAQLSKAAHSACDQIVRRREGDAYIDEVQCRIGRYQTTARTELRMSGDSRYRLEMDTRYDPAMPGMEAESRTAVDAHWVGPCEAGQTPGEVFLRRLDTGELIRFPVHPAADRAARD